MSQQSIDEGEIKVKIGGLAHLEIREEKRRGLVEMGKTSGGPSDLFLRKIET